MLTLLQVAEGIAAGARTAERAIDQGPNGLLLVFCAIVVAGVLAVVVYLARNAPDKETVGRLAISLEALATKQTAIETSQTTTNERLERQGEDIREMRQALTRLADAEGATNRSIQDLAGQVSRIANQATRNLSRETTISATG